MGEAARPLIGGKVNASAQTGAALPPTASPLITPNFSGRQVELDCIERLFWTDRSPVVAIIPASSKASEGVGKTSLAVAYAERYLDRYCGVCWVDARFSAAIERQLGFGIARLPAASINRQQMFAVLASEQDGRPWLVVLDDFADVSAVEAYLPGGKAHVLITSSCPFWPRAIATIRLDVFPTDVATGYLMRTGSIADAGSAQALALQLGYLPLALEQASAFCRRSGISATSYASLADAWTKDVKLPQADSPVFATTSIALDHIKAVSDVVEPLAEALAVLSPNGISAEWLTESQGVAPAQGVLTPRIGDAFELLCDWSLAKSHVGDRGKILSIHPLVQRVVRQRALLRNTLQGALATAGLAIRRELSRDPPPAVVARAPRPMELPVLPHAMAVVAFADAVATKPEDLQIIEGYIATASAAPETAAQLPESRVATAIPAGATRNRTSRGGKVLLVLLTLLVLCGIGVGYYALKEPRTFEIFVNKLRAETGF